MGILPSQRHLFSIPDEVSYFNCAYNSPQLLESTRRLNEGAASKNYPWKRVVDDFFDDAEAIRELSAELFEGDKDGFAIHPSVSYGVSTAARAIEPGLKTGDEILNIAEEFPSNVLPWRRTADQTGARIVIAKTPEDGNWTRAILNTMNPRVKVVAVSTCHWTNGAYIDLKSISQACRENNSIMVVDATQSLGAMPFSIKEIKPDFLVSAGYKWMLGPYGFSLLYVSEPWRDARPLEETWLVRSNARDFAGLVNYSDDYLPGARKFDVGETCTPTILPGAVAALEQIREWGVGNIAETLLEINKQVAQHLEELEFTLPDKSQRCPHLFGATLPKHYNGNLVSELSKKDIYISQRGNALRFAPYLHITENDISRLFEAIDELIV